MNMYQSGELEAVMKNFEKVLKDAPIYVGGDFSRVEREEKVVDGMIQKRYKNENYYNSGQVNQLFLMYFRGYASGKCTERLGEWQ